MKHIKKSYTYCLHTHQTVEMTAVDKNCVTATVIGTIDKPRRHHAKDQILNTIFFVIFNFMQKYLTLNIHPT